MTPIRSFSRLHSSLRYIQTPQPTPTTLSFPTSTLPTMKTKGVRRDR